MKVMPLSTFIGLGLVTSGFLLSNYLFYNELKEDYNWKEVAYSILDRVYELKNKNKSLEAKIKSDEFWIDYYQDIYNDLLKENNRLERVNRNLRKE